MAMKIDCERRFNRFGIMIMAAVLGVGLVPAAMAGTIYTTLGPGGVFDTNDFVHFTASSPPGAYADEFTSPVSANVQSVSLALALDAAPILSGPATVNITIRTNLATGTAGVLGTFSTQITSEQARIYTLSSTASIHLNAGAEYWLTAGTDGGPIKWFDNDQGIDNRIASRSDGTWTVLGSEPALAFSINSVPEPESLGLCALSVVSAFVWRRRIVKAKGAIGIVDS